MGRRVAVHGAGRKPGPTFPCLATGASVPPPSGPVAISVGAAGDGVWR